VTDLQSTLDAIDELAVHHCGWCQNPLADDAPSPDFCNERCQELWSSRQRQSVKPPPAPARTSQPLDIHILPRPDCTCTICSSSTVRPAPAQVYVSTNPDADPNDRGQWQHVGWAEPDALVMRVEPDISRFADRVRRLGELMGASVGMATAAFTAFSEAMRSATVQLADRADLPLHLLWPDEPRPDVETPQERALRLRRTRNTGPRPRRRAPRQIDARRAR
jgi:hypothetical protein